MEAARFGGPVVVDARDVLVLARELAVAPDGVSGRVGLLALDCFAGLRDGGRARSGVDVGVVMPEILQIGVVVIR